MKDRKQVQREIEALVRRSEQLQAQARELQHRADVMTKQMKELKNRQAEAITGRKST